MNGATEATLQDLLIVARQMNANLEALVKKLGASVTTASGATSGGSGAGGSPSAAAPAMSNLATAASMVGKSFFTLGSIVGSLIKGVFSLLGSVLGGMCIRDRHKLV